MVRHPHFTQPIFVRFPRPAVMRGRDGAERFPQAADVPFHEAVLRSLRTLDPSLTMQWLQDVVSVHEDELVLRARNATLRERPSDVRKFFQAQFRAVLAPQTTQNRPSAVPIVSTPSDDPYGF